ncbi:MAG TPA: VanW family protein [Methylomirabilota bacterium]|nr:VanW family protein [Methylomirabilota bacterium]
MKYKIFLLFIIILFIMVLPVKALPSVTKVYSSNEHLLSQHTMSLEDRYANKSVNDVFKDNILLTIAYLSGKVKDPAKIDWNQVRSNSEYNLVLNPGEVFAFHDDVLPEFDGKTIKTTNAHFGPSEGFVSDGFLYGDGVCHFASLINWAARDAGLKVTAPTNHDFANIPDVPKENGTAIYTTAGKSSASELQNLYFENNFDKPVHMVFTYANNTLTISLYE